MLFNICYICRPWHHVYVRLKREVLASNSKKEKKRDPVSNTLLPWHQHRHAFWIASPGQCDVELPMREGGLGQIDTDTVGAEPAESFAPMPPSRRFRELERRPGAREPRRADRTSRHRRSFASPRVVHGPRIVTGPPVRLLLWNDGRDSPDKKGGSDFGQKFA